MTVSRRDFVKNSLLTGGALLTFPACTRPPDGAAASFQPAYARLEEEGKFEARVEEAQEMLQECRICPRLCGVNRVEGATGFCRSPEKTVLYNYGPHLGEEIPLIGRRGSGTIFFSNCSLRCVFCQNWPTAHVGRGQQVTDEMLAAIMLEVQRMGCHNINLVTPTHVMPSILRATRLALHRGLRLPLVYNTGGYERPEIIRLLDGIVDIYLPDVKYMDGNMAARYSADAKDYPEMAKASVLEMQRQVGTLVTDSNGIAQRGLMIRHLVLPNRVAGTKELVEWVAGEFPKDTYINIMAQYRVEYEAFNYPQIARAIRPDEFVEAMEWAMAAGLTNLDSRSVSQWQVYRRRSSEDQDHIPGMT